MASFQYPLEHIRRLFAAFAASLVAFPMSSKVLVHRLSQSLIAVQSLGLASSNDWVANLWKGNCRKSDL